MRSSAWPCTRTSSGSKSRDIAQIAEFVSRTPDDFTVLAGSATTLVHALCAGCDGAILALAALVPDACNELLTPFVRAGWMRRELCSDSCCRSRSPSVELAWSG